MHFRKRPHPAVPSRPHRRRATTTAAILIAVVSIAGVAYAAIDPWPSYQPQTVCSPTAKKGTLELARYLQSKYPGSGSYGISRACGSGGRSEHKEGRAFDWRVNVNNARERGYAYAFIKRVRATDAAGNTAALARRMGIMYLIYNDVIYSSSRNFAPKAYLNSGCASVATCSATLRHRDHMHISLTRAGGHGWTSWYGNHSIGSGGSAPTAPTPPDLAQEDIEIPMTTLAKPEVLVVEPGGTSRSRLAVRKGRTVKVTAYGVTRFGPGHQLVSDATCVWNPTKRAWSKNPRAADEARYGDPELRVNGVAVFAKASCRGGQHVYTANVVQNSTSRVKVTLGGRDQDQGAVKVILSRTTTKVQPMIPPVRAVVAAPGPTPPTAGRVLTVSDDVRVGTSDVVWSDEVLEAGVEYRVTVTGTRRIARGVYTDGRCLAINGRWETQGSTDLYRPGATHGALYLGGRRFTGTAPADDRTGCALHTHTASYTPTTPGRVALRLWDPTGPGDNDGSLTVRFERVTPVPLPTAAPAEPVTSTRNWRRGSETVTVRARSASGTVSSLRLLAGTTATVYVRGTAMVSGTRSVDAACVQRSRSWLTTLGLPSGQDIFELSVDGQDVEWRARNSGGTGCDSRHEYVARITATKDGPVRLALADLDYGDNSGELTVTIVRD